MVLLFIFISITDIYKKIKTFIISTDLSVRQGALGFLFKPLFILYALIFVVDVVRLLALLHFSANSVRAILIFYAEKEGNVLFSAFAVVFCHQLSTAARYPFARLHQLSAVGTNKGVYLRVL